jgi:hypothetical protein
MTTGGRWGIHVRRDAVRGVRSGEGPQRRLRRQVAAVFATLVLLAVAGHVAFWYLPRERGAMPRPGDLPARLLAGGGYDLCLWIPYPHQNLGALAGHFDDPQAYLDAAAEAAGLPRPEVPRFGPFAVPPARELMAAGDLTGERFVLAARVYPLLAGVARLAGWLGSNPWLRGGEAESGGRRVRVSWQGTLWTVEPAGTNPSGREVEASPEAAERVPPAAGAAERPPADRGAPSPTGAGEAAPAAGDEAPSLARLVLSRGIGPVPAGHYLLRRQGTGLEVRGEGGFSPEAPAGLAAAVTALAFASTDSSPADRRSPRALALFAENGSFGLPGMAAFHRAGGERWKLPGEGILGLLGGDLPTGEAAGWQIVALDRESRRRALDLAPDLAALEQSGVEAAQWLAPGPAHRTVEQVAALLEGIPIVGSRHAKRWRTWELLLRPLADRRELSILIGRGRSQLWATLR